MRIRAVARVLAAIVIGALLVAPAQASARTDPLPAASAAGPSATVSAAPWCNKTPWKSGTMQAFKLDRRLKRVADLADKADTATDIVALMITGLSLGSLTAPAALVKAVAKVGKAALKRTLKSLRKQVRRVHPRHRQTGVKLRIKCKLGFAPYPSFGVYTR